MEYYKKWNAQKASDKGIHLNIDGKLTNNYQTIVGSVNILLNNWR